MGHVLLTGATGMIGRFILRDLAARDVDAAVLVRGANAEQRIANVIESLGQLHPSCGVDDSIPTPRVIRGDLHAADLALSAEDADWVERNVDSVIHCAGDVSFGHDGAADDVWRTNVDGTTNLARAALARGIEAFSFVSTAFVCGDRQGIVREDEARSGQGFGSVYEEAKLRAEEVLAETGLERVKIFRPCFVGGDTVTGFSSTFHGIYWFALFTAMARLRAGVSPGERWHHDVRIFRSPDLRHYMVPVDAVSRAVVELHEDEAAPTGAYHLTPPRSFDLRLVESSLRRHYGFEGVRFADPVDPAEWNETEQLFYEGLRAIGHRYLDGDPTFDCSKTLGRLAWWKSVTIDEDYLVRLYAYADSVRFGRGPARRREPLPAV